MTINSIQRPDYGTLSVYGEENNGLDLGGLDRLYVTNAPTVTATNTANAQVGNGMVAPWMVDYQGRYFLSYGSTGFVPAVFTVTGAATGGGAFTSGPTDVVNLPSGGTIQTGGQSAYAVRVGGSPSTTTYTLNSNAPADILTIGSGGLILDSYNGTNTTSITTGECNQTANINFGSSASPVEGVIYIGLSGGPQQFQELSGALQSWGGLTISSLSATNHNAQLAIPNANMGLVGQITIDDAYVDVGNNNSLGPATNPIYLNTPFGDGANSPSGALSATANVTIANTITLGPLGGGLNTSYSSFTVSGQITGSGTLFVNGFHNNGLTLSNTSATTPNNWTGGTWIEGTNLTLNNGAALGTGPVVINGLGGNAGRLHLNGGSQTVTIPGRVIFEDTFYDYASGLYLENGAYQFSVGSIEGNGSINFDNGGYLTVGSDNLSTDFYGRIADTDQKGWGAGYLTKTGTGTLTLWGDTLISGSVTVNGGTLAINGSLNGAPLAPFRPSRLPPGPDWPARARLTPPPFWSPAPARQST